MSTARNLVLVLLVLLALAALFALAPRRAHADDVARGRALYTPRCAVCHGREGRGDGAIARYLDPAPRDFSSGVYKLRSTATGELPTDDDLLRTLARGIPGTAMPAWSGLSLADRRALVAYLKTLSPRFSRTPAAEVVPIPEPTQASAAALAAGARTYELMQCARCHAADGRGRGVVAPELVDDRGRRAYPFDFSRSWKLKGGASVTDLYRTLHTGIDGTPMPSYHDSLSPEDTWPLVHHLRSLFLDGRDPR